MKNFFSGFLFAAVLSFFVILPVYAQQPTAEGLVDQIKQATDVQRTGIIKQNIGKKIHASGVVSDVKEYLAFDERMDKKQLYYEVATELQNTAAGTPYKVLFFYKDKDSIKDINRGQKIEHESTVLKIFDTRLWIEIWLYNDQYGAEEETMFGEQGALPEIPKVD